MRKPFARASATVALLAVALLAVPVASPAAAQDLPQTTESQPSTAELLLAVSDSLFEAGDSAGALAGYRDVLVLDPWMSRAAYQLGRLLPPGSEQQIAAFRSYIQLEPTDAWGFSALARALSDAGRPDEARRAYDAALELAPGATDIRAGYESLVLEGSAESADPWSFGPSVRRSGDSDGNHATELGIRSERQLAAGPIGMERLAVEVLRVNVADATRTVTAWAPHLQGSARPAPALRLEGELGLVSTDPGEAAARVTELTGALRVRWRPASGPAAEIRARRTPIMATPLLLAAPVVLTEGRIVLDLPLHGRLHGRTLGRWGRLAAPADANHRTMVGVGPVLRLGPAFEANALVGRSGYGAPTAAGYFAPERVDLAEVGIYWEQEGERWLVALDAGMGAERIQPFESSPGDWGRAFRWWALAQWGVTPGLSLRLEAEAYDTRAGEALVAAGEGWRWFSADVSVRLRP